MFQPAPDAPNPGAADQAAPASPFQPQQPANAAGMGFSPATPLFKPLAGESVQAAAVAASPFAAQSMTSTGAPLTVGDVLPQLPPELIRANALSPDQPVAVSPQVLDAALKSGQAALPIFEIFRVCPALFQVPVAPQDPRMVPLPAAKLPRLIASAQQAVAPGSQGSGPGAAAPGGQAPLFPPQPAGVPQGAAGPVAGVSPFSAPAASPFQPATGAGTVLPPRRTGPPPPLAEIPGRDAPAPSLSLSAPNALGFGGGASPFSAAAPVSAAGGSPFQAAGSVAAAPGSVTAPGASPFSASFPAAAAPAPASLSPQPNLPQSAPFQPFAAAGGLPAATTPGVPPAAAAGQDPATPASPFSPFQLPSTQAGSASAFAAPAQGPASSGQPVAPAPGASGATTLGGLFSTKGPTTGGASPFSTAAPTPAPAQAGVGVGGPSPFPVGSGMPAAPAAPATQGQSLRIGLAGLLRGYSVAEIGFDPAMVPAWIMTSLPASKVREWAATPNSLAELGLLLDGITDIGFRTVLNHAKRDFLISIPQEEMSLALASAPGASAMPPASPVPLGQPGTLRINPGEPPAAAAMPSSLAHNAPVAEAQVVVEPKPEVAAVPPAYATVGFGTQGASVVFPQAPSAEGGAAASPFIVPAGGGFAPPVSETPPQPAAVPLFTPRAEPPATGLPERQGVPAGAGSPPASAFGMTAPAPSEGFSSAELLGGMVESVPPAPSIPVTNPFTGKNATEVVDVPAEDVDAASDFPYAAAPGLSKPLFPPAEEISPPKSPVSAPRVSMPPASPSFSPAAETKSGGMPALGIRSDPGNPDQILLRALLGTDENLTPQRVVEMVCGLPGIAACVCLHDGRALSHVGAHKPQAREFQRQATDLAQHLRTLAPLIGIEGAETFTLTSGDRLMTFCFPDHAILGVLHDAEPSLGLRDKITLIGRELARMLG